MFTKSPHVGNNETRAERHWSKDISDPNMGRVFWAPLSEPLIAIAYISFLMYIPSQ